MRIVIFAAFLLMMASTTAACSLTFEPLAAPSPAEVVFTATVEGFSPGTGTAASAVLLRNVHPVWPPSQPGTRTVRVFQLLASCGLENVSVASLQAQFPTGSQVAVVAAVQHTGTLPTYEVVLGGNSSLDPASQLSDRFVVRKKLASLETSHDESERVAILQTLLRDSTGEINIGGALARYVHTRSARESLVRECRNYWQPLGGISRCEPPN